MRTGSFVAALAVSAVALAACGTSGSEPEGTPAPTATGTGAAIDARPEADAGMRLVVTTTILGDVVARLVGDDAVVEVLLPPGQDPHGYAPSAQDAQTLREADLVIANGHALEEALVDVIHAAEGDGVKVLRVAEEIDALPTDEHGTAEHEEDRHADDEHTEGEDHDHGPVDPHFWFDPLRMAAAVEVIAEHVAEIDESDVEWHQRGEALAAEMEDLDGEVAAILDTVPAGCRRLVTNHDNLGYFADRYGFEVVGTVVPGTSTQAEPSARDFADLAQVLRDTGVPAIFAETVQSMALAETLAQEVGREVAVVTLYTDSLGEPGSGAETYAGLMTTDARRVADALSDC